METRLKMHYETPTVKKSQVILDGSILAASVMADKNDSNFILNDEVDNIETLALANL